MVIWLLIFAFEFILGQPVTLTVNTQYGPVEGIQEDGIMQWKGIPYAQPPIPRFNDPVPPNPWTSVLPAHNAKPSCPQHCALPPLLCPQNYSEDCLYLNIHVPLNTQIGDKKPVMVFIYGGAYFQGTSNTPLYSPVYIVKNTNTIVVTFDYRLGAFGFLVNSKVAGNFGIHDQRMVLKFVQNNIAKFGGDPNSVTLFGESAGAMSTAVHLISPLSKGLFHRAILESDPLSLEIPSIEQNADRNSQFAKYIGCDAQDIECMRSKTTDQALSASSQTNLPVDTVNFTLEIILPWRPVLGDEIPTQVLTALKYGKWNQVPLIIGTNNNEGVMFVNQIASFINNFEYLVALTAIFKTYVQDVLSVYPVTLDPITNVKDTLSTLLTHYLFSCPSRYLAETIQSTNPVWVYHFNRVSTSSSQVWGTKYQFCWDVVCHGSELIYVFDSFGPSNVTATQQELDLSQQIVNYWTNFAHNSNPNTGNTVSVQWPSFNNQTKQNILLDVPISTESWIADYCDFWDKVGYFF